MKLYRASGMPIDVRHAELTKERFKARFDELEVEHGKASQENSAIFTEELQKLEDECLAEYPRSREIDIFEVPSIVDEFKAAVAVTKSLVNGEEEFCAYIMDQEG